MDHSDLWLWSQTHCQGPNYDSISYCVILEKACIVKAVVFPVVMYGCESWTIRKIEHWKIHAFELWCWRRLLRVPWTSRRSNHSILKEISLECSFRRTDTEAEVPIVWPPVMKSWLIRKDPDDGKDWRHKERGMTEIEMVGWHHWLNRHEFEQALGDGEGQGTLACCSPWSHKELDTPERLNWLTKVGPVVCVSFV